jgi:hypothetical protein
VFVTACGDGDGEAREPRATDEGCSWSRRTVARDEVTAVLDTSVAEVGERFHIGEGPWSCRVSWAALSYLKDADWTPSGVETEATLSLAWGHLAEEVTGGAPPGRRLACPGHLDIEAVLSFEAADGSLAEAWTVTGKYIEGDDFTVEVHPREIGGYRGDYDFQWQSEWPEIGSTFFLVLRLDHAEGRIVEWTHRTGERWVGASGEGIVANPATWTCVRE